MTKNEDQTDTGTNETRYHHKVSRNKTTRTEEAISLAFLHLNVASWLFIVFYAGKNAIKREHEHRQCGCCRFRNRRASHRISTSLRHSAVDVFPEKCLLEKRLRT